MKNVDGRILALGVVAIAAGCIAGYMAFHKDGISMPRLAQAETSNDSDLWKDMNTGERVASSNNPEQGTQAIEVAQVENISGEDTSATEVANIEPAAGEEASDPACKFDKWKNKEMDDKVVNSFVKIGRPYRILAPGAIYTQDFSPDRININLDDKGIILDIWCG